MVSPTLEACRQLFGDAVRAAVAAGSNDSLSYRAVAALEANAIANVEEGRHLHCHTHGDGAEHCEEHGEGEHGHSHGCASVHGDYMLGLHIAAIFIVLLASAVGTLIPILGKYVPALQLPVYVYALGKAAATGVVLAVAMIHMIQHADVVFKADCIPESFKERFEGWAFLFAMIAAIVMHSIDGSIGWVAELWAARAIRKESSYAPCGDSLCKESPLVGGGECVQATSDSVPSDMGGCVEDGKASAAVRRTITIGCAGHSHGVAAPEDMPAVQRVVAALCMEFGVTLHSVFVGLALAMSNGADLRALIIALVFHQLFEGLAMGARLADASFRLSVGLVLMLVFSLSAPIGIAAGTGAVMASRDAFSGTTYAFVSAILDSVCGGIMLYIAFNLLFLDFPHDLRVHCGVRSKFGVVKRIGLYAALWLGAGLMALMGKWL
ncbi:hypothetical protein JKF63_03616 [Porcisia hertigi]|uniref:Uncharacterized protein n=1 Tax=Porcisia hertigi TaxID=2761500 RepID=A0A836I8R4_9TRYP|nr:hypothetical protein JKF63_03616 [Porcisia hertigi]